ncbi:MAG: tRNA modification GTPase MnmE [Bacillota bacterium]|jgi:tRNA modification GTPase
MMPEETIVALATAPGNSGIAIVRVSGPRAIEAVSTIYRGKQDLEQVNSHTVHYGLLVHPVSFEHIDRVLVTVMRAPRSFTGEDVVEISCHGSMVVVHDIVAVLGKVGVRVAEPGEFTKRAFLNGKLDLAQAEAVADLIVAKTKKAAKLALNQVEGYFSRVVTKLREQLAGMLAHLAVNIDYPEYDLEELSREQLLEKVLPLKGQLDLLLNSARQGQVYRGELLIGLVGRPNVGKSSFLNCWLKEDRAIVSDLPGTTRDVLSASLNLRGLAVKLLDTAGIHETEDKLEGLGVMRSLAVIEKAQLLIYLVDSSVTLRKEVRAQLTSLALRNVPKVVVLSKSDLPSKVSVGEIEDVLPGVPVSKISVVTGEGLKAIEQIVWELLTVGRGAEDEELFLTTERQLTLLQVAAEAVNDVACGLKSEKFIDMLEIDLRRAWSVLGEVLGTGVAENLIDEIFGRFCLGK